MKLRMRVTEDRLEKDQPGAPRRKTIGLELVPSDASDDNAKVNASSGQLQLHGAHEPGFLPFAEGGDYYVIITPAPPLVVVTAEPEKAAP